MNLKGNRVTRWTWYLNASRILIYIQNTYKFNQGFNHQKRKIQRINTYTGHKINQKTTKSLKWRKNNLITS